MELFLSGVNKCNNFVSSERGFFVFFIILQFFEIVYIDIKTIHESNITVICAVDSKS